MKKQFIAGLFLFACQSLCALNELPIVVIIPSYNNEEWTEKTLTSVLEQEYSTMRVIFIDDASTDRNFTIAQEVVERYHAESKVLLVHNKVRCGALANTYTAIHSCRDDELWIVLDGDDWFPHNQTLATFNRYYQEHDAWASFGQYVDWPVGKVGHAEAFPEDVIRTNTLRSYRLPSRRAYLPITAPRTGYAWLFKLICLQDLLYDDYFYIMAGDYAYMVPELELAGFHGIFIPDILYVYNVKNPIADARVNAHMQAQLAVNVLHKKPYNPVTAPRSVDTIEKNDVATLIVFSDNTPSALHNLLNGVRSVRPVAAVVVFYYADQVHEAAYNDLAAIFPGMRFIHTNEHSFSSLLHEQLDHMRGDYVLLCSDTAIISGAISLNDDIRLLKKTHTSIFFYALGADQDADLFVHPKLPPVNLPHTRYGWYTANKKGDWHVPMTTMTLYEKRFLQSLFKNCFVCRLHDLDDILAKQVTENKMLGLIGNERSVIFTRSVDGRRVS